MKNQIQVPFIGDKQVTWFYEHNKSVKLVDNYTFKSTLRYVGFSRGRSALNIEWLDLSNNKTYHSGMSLLDESLKGNNNPSVSEIAQIFQIEGEFTFKKQGTSILLTYAK